MEIEPGWVEIGERIAHARKTRQLSQQQLADALAIDRTAITKLETGRRQLKMMELVRLSEILQRHMDWFILGPHQAVVSRRAAVGGGVEEKIERVIEDLARDVSVLVDVRSLTPRRDEHIRAIKPGDSDWAAEAAAADARELLRLDPYQPVLDLAELVERTGLLAFSFPLGDSAADGAYTLVEGVGMAVVNGDLPAGRRRSTLAHELGHHLFGDAYSLDWGAHTSSNEDAIDGFAVNLLFPRAGVTRRWRTLRQEGDLRYAAIVISAEYRVSWTAALRQLRRFDLVSADEYRTLDSRSPTKADYLECNVRVVEELSPTHIATGLSAAAIHAYRTYGISDTRAIEILRGQVDVGDLPEPNKIPFEARRAELRGEPT
ncbi:helix-turn-helix domain-containing protein [Herbidospora cretacea]|uniref:helix-turn-helix domain-containing protein n=1 Tax=Herbidospora cretacea TaxID=28444 RepID=UPI0004C4727F|nr:XRE family transcriptional regulator [Herbidospora cretacea]